MGISLPEAQGLGGGAGMLPRREGLRIGVVGCGYWGPKHVRVLHTLDAVSGVVLIDSRADRLAGLARMFPAVQCFPTLRSALPHTDALVIATPSTTHVPLALEAIRAGKHVLVEKPLATTTCGARQLVEASAEADVVLMVGHTFEYNAAVRNLRHLVHSRELGDLYYIDSARLNLGLYQCDVNVIADLAPHDISIINYLLGSRPDTVHAWASRHAHTRFEDVAYLRLYYADVDVSANIHVSWLDPCKERRVTVVGSRKMAVYNDLATEEQVRIHDKGVLIPAGHDQNATQPPMSYRYGAITSPFVAFEEPLAVQDRHFVECVLTGATPQSDGEQGLAVVEVLESAQLSLDEGRQVLVEEVATASVGRDTGHRGRRAAS